MNRCPIFLATFAVAPAIALLAIALMIAPLTSCRSTTKEAPAETCTKVGETCKLSRGLLGVCIEAAPGECDREPCYVCQGQH